MTINRNGAIASALFVMLSTATPLAAQLIGVLPKEPITRPTGTAGAPPAAFRISATSPTSATLAWDATAGAMTYTLLRTTGIGGQWTNLTPTPLPASTLSYNDNGGIDY